MTDRLGGLEIYHKLKRVGCSTGTSAGLIPRTSVTTCRAGIADPAGNDGTAEREAAFLQNEGAWGQVAG